MCTVTYLPQAGGFILTHNRDEAPTRSPQDISREKRPHDTLIFPRDSKAGGAWIAAARSGKLACLLNGAFEKHQHAPPYRRSRGLVLLDFFDWPEPDRFFEQYPLDDIEPFTFLFFAEGRVCQMRWDGARRYVQNLPPAQAHFWCSATLYPAPMREKREALFLQFLQQKPKPKPSDLLRLHRTGSVGDPENDFVMNRNGRVQTVSISQVVSRDAVFHFRYFDLLGARHSAKQIKFG